MEDMNKNKKNRILDFLPFKEARELVRNLKLKNKQEWMFLKIIKFQIIYQNHQIYFTN